MRMAGKVGARGRQVVGACLVVAMASGVCVGTAQAVGVPGQGTWETTLQGRDLDGNAANGFEAYYDTALDLTWLADANYVKTSGYDTDGYMDWNAAQAWAANLNVNGTTNWRLPTMVETDTTGCDFSFAGGTDCGFNVQTKDAVSSTVYSEMAHMFYVTLGNKAAVDAAGNILVDGAGNILSGFGLTNTGPFKNVQSDSYWFGVEYEPYTYGAWVFDIYGGGQSPFNKVYEFAAWAVRPGDVAAAVPEPSSYALALAGFAVAGLARRRRAVDVMACQRRISP